eukprot:gb/GECH01011974.1/.p1 GENE.gb/GECH01011974.1/~~gb/GECH01011974.1/.p1  ORF type:complete len:206 (+),score=39.50 gb/GECH01011974.1/:1-618(+)
MNPLEYNGSAIIAMVGKNCVAIAADKRFGAQLQTISTDMKKIYKMHDHLYVGMTGLPTDNQTLYELLRFKLNLYNLHEGRLIKPTTFAKLVSSTLYERRFAPYFTQPVIAGLEGSENRPFVCTMDLIGALSFSENFVVGGTCSESLYGMCESLWRPDMEPEDLFETISQALLASIDRDSLSGWGGVVQIITHDKVTTKHLRTRQD